MPKLPRDVSHDALVRFLRKRGWTYSPGARHTLMVRGDAQLTVPRHDRLKTGTLAAILKQAGVGEDEWGDL
jgi:predicted RNA binding protein YcfA (HicA-like mRNA interferase family)